MKSPFDKRTESTRRFDALNVNNVLRYSYDICQKSEFKKTNVFLQTFTLSLYVMKSIHFTDDANDLCVAHVGFV